MIGGSIKILPSFAHHWLCPHKACSDSQEKGVFIAIQQKAKPRWVSSLHARNLLHCSLPDSSITHQPQDSGISTKPLLADGAPDPVANLGIRKAVLSAYFTETASISNLQGLECAREFTTSQPASKFQRILHEKMVASGLSAHYCHLSVKLTFPAAIHIPGSRNMWRPTWERARRTCPWRLHGIW